MEESVSPELAHVPEPSLDPVDSGSQEPSVDLNQDTHDQCDVDEKLEDAEKNPKPPCEFKKTWGFRRTTIAKREVVVEMAAETPEGKAAPVRRSGRQAKRTDKLEEFLVTVKRGRGPVRRSCPSRLEGGDPPSQTPTDAETASEASFDGNAEAKTDEAKPTSPSKKRKGRGNRRRAAKSKTGAGSVSDDGSSENEEEADSEIKTEAQEQETVKPEMNAEEEKDEGLKDEQSVQVTIEKKDEEEVDEQKVSSDETINRRSTRSTSREAKREGKPAAEAKKEEEEDEEYSEDEESSSSESDGEDYDPNALYCICRQKHNKRFMICCDRCEEWFHGDCVGISEARGRLMERNGEDYVCPKCSTQKGHGPKASSSSAAAENAKRPFAGLRKTEPSAAASTEERTADDLGIKGRIEKATNPSGKKKIKIFQPVTAVKGSSLPKCIGPGCNRDALPDSVYCGNDCILRHAAAAMKTITTDGKDSKQKEKGKPKAQARNKMAQKNSGSERRTSNQGEEESASGPEEDDKDDEDKHAEEHPPPPAMSSWSSDHNYIAVTPEKTSPISASVLNKACMYLSEGFPSSIHLSIETPIVLVF